LKADDPQFRADLRHFRNDVGILSGTDQPGFEKILLNTRKKSPPMIDSTIVKSFVCVKTQATIPSGQVIGPPFENNRAN
jgi:hypothetical protein